jgi:hypothetical protein
MAYIRIYTKKSGSVKTNPLNPPDQGDFQKSPWNWTDWIDYWAVDFNFESKREIVRVQNPDNGAWEDVWTGDCIFENEWQSFRRQMF